MLTEIKLQDTEKSLLWVYASDQIIIKHILSERIIELGNRKKYFRINGQQFVVNGFVQICNTRDL